MQQLGHSVALSAVRLASSPVDRSEPEATDVRSAVNYAVPRAVPPLFPLWSRCTFLNNVFSRQYHWECQLVGVAGSLIAAYMLLCPRTDEGPSCVLMYSPSGFT